MDLTNAIVGVRTVDMVDGKSKRINIDKVVYDTNGCVMAVITTSREVYNWKNIIAIRRYE